VTLVPLPVSIRACYHHTFQILAKLFSGDFEVGVSVSESKKTCFSMFLSAKTNKNLFLCSFVRFPRRAIGITPQHLKDALFPQLPFAPKKAQTTFQGTGRAR